MSKIPYDLKQIKAVVFDVDGVLSTSTIPLGDNGVPRRTVNTKDGFAMQLAIKCGLSHLMQIIHIKLPPRGICEILISHGAPGTEDRYSERIRKTQIAESIVTELINSGLVHGKLHPSP